MDVLNNFIVVTFLNEYINEIIMAYTLNIYNFTCQLYFNKAGK